MSPTPGTPATLPLAKRLTSNLVRGPLFFFFTGFFGCISLAASCVEEDGRWQHNIARLWARMSLRSAGAPVTVIGRENFLPLAIYTSNHTSFMDTPVVFSSLPFQFRILAKQSLWKWPFIGWHLNRSGQIPVDEESGSGSIAGLNRAIKALKAGLPLFIFPEGGRTHDGQNAAFHAGAGIYIDTVAGSAGADGADWHLRTVAHSHPPFPSPSGQAGYRPTHRSGGIYHPPSGRANRQASKRDPAALRAARWAW